MNEQDQPTHRNSWILMTARWLLGDGGRGTAKVEKGAGAKFTVMEGDLASGAEHEMQFTDDVELCTCIPSLTKATPTHWIKLKQISRSGNISSTHTAAAHWSFAAGLALEQKLGLFLNLKWEEGSLAMIQTIGTYGLYSFC